MPGGWPGSAAARRSCVRSPGAVPSRRDPGRHLRLDRSPALGGTDSGDGLGGRANTDAPFRARRVGLRQSQLVTEQDLLQRLFEDQLWEEERIMPKQTALIAERENK